ncbi:26S proteasome non-ATPase regulatory subunit 9 [Brevipalpus obovatus]|uniref:26S proteasome non-ATPase regulatory subunit 9 n=1 Tax=Brevipalpus obovatus TaxID=246614 RepID=UPI003D9EFD49
MPGASKREELRQELLAIHRKRSALEKEILAFHEVLKSQNVGLTDALVDENDFPREDLNLYQIRTARNKIICLTNDCRSLTLEMERKMHELHSIDKEAQENSSAKTQPFSSPRQQQ